MNGLLCTIMAIEQINNNNNVRLQACQWKSLINQQEFETFEYQQEEIKDEQNKLNDEFISKIKRMKMGKSSKECSVCQLSFQAGEIIMKLPCDHIFHQACIVPWLKKSSMCPNCKFDLKTYFK